MKDKILNFFWEKSPFWVKCLMVIIFGPLGALGSIVGTWMAIEAYGISKVNSVIEPVRVQVNSLSRRQDDMIRAHDYQINSLDAKLNILIKRK